MDLLGLALAAWLGGGAPNKTVAALAPPEVTFNPRQRAVSNWRREAAFHLESSPGVAAGMLLGRDPAPVTRCVRLNNYWCIKRAGWAGEIAADTEGHVAFASAAEGADVAALLLRRYYVDYGRHSALAIISHWAPVSCGGAAAPAGFHGSGAAAPARAAADHLATHGLGHTLRARFLASRGRRVAGGARLRARGSVVPDRLIGQPSPMPSIVIGLGDAPVDLGIRSLEALPLTALAPAAPVRLGSDHSTCFADNSRIRNYAAKAAAGVAQNPTDDLKLFDGAGMPTANLARVMHNMSAVEVGPLGADEALVSAAVDHARQLAAAALRGKAAAPRGTAAPVADR